MPWVDELTESVSQSDCADSEPNLKHPIGQLKQSHNFLQSQFSDCIKMLILWSYSSDNHPTVGVPMLLISAIPSLAESLRHLSKYRQIFHMKTKSNLSHSNKRECPLPLTTLVTSLRTLSLHIFEVSEFSSQLSDSIDNRPNPQQPPNRDWLIAQREFLEKSKKHFDGLQNHWQGLCDELDALLSSSDAVNSVVMTAGGGRGQMCDDSDDKEEDGVVIDDYPEIVDEVIEGMPDEGDIDNRHRHGSELVDPFEERYATNARAILTELKSVIDVRAKDWRKREKLALKRRVSFCGGEGRFLTEILVVVAGGRGQVRVR